MKWLLLLPLVAALSLYCKAADVGPTLQATSVNVKAAYAQGSGTVVLRKVGEVDTAFILTAAHVVRDLRDVSTSIVNGEERKSVTYRDAQVVQEVPTTDQARIVGDRRLDAQVICVDSSRDIALLRVRATREFKQGAAFYTGEAVPPVGTAVFHCGAPGGQDTGGTATLTAGIVSRTGVRIAEYGGANHGVYDQTDTAALGGSSGGMVCLRDSGQWIGMITLGLQGGDSFHWFVPIRNVRAWAKQAGCEWLLADGGRTTEEDLAKLPVEPSGTAGGGTKATEFKRAILTDDMIGGDA